MLLKTSHCSSPTSVSLYTVITHFISILNNLVVFEQFIQSPIDDHPNCFQGLAILNEYSMNPPIKLRVLT